MDFIASAAAADVSRPVSVKVYLPGVYVPITQDGKVVVSLGYILDPEPEIIESCLFAQGTPSGGPSVHPPRWGRFFDALSLEGG